MEELTDEQLDIQEEKQAREIVRANIESGKDLETLRKNPAFERLILGKFMELGKDVLWQNIKHLTEEQLAGRGNDKNLEMIELIKGQLKSRIDFDTFMRMVDSDYENTLADIEEEKEA